MAGIPLELRRYLRPALYMVLVVALASLVVTVIAMISWRQGKIAGLVPRPSTPANIVQPADPPVLLLFGDSRIAQWRTLPRRPYRIVREGHAGATAIELAALYPQALQRHRPAVVILQMGINDAVAAALVSPSRRDRALRDSAAAIDAMAHATRAAGADAILLNVAPPLRPSLIRRLVYRDLVSHYVLALNTELRAIATRRGARIADPVALLTGNDGQVPDIYRRDTLHWTPAAYAALDALLPATLGNTG